MSRFVPLIHFKPGIPPIYQDKERPKDHQKFGPDDTANAIRVLTEACKLWTDVFVQQIDHVDISWAGYFEASYHFVILCNTSFTDCWAGTVVIESRFETPEEVVVSGRDLAKKLLKDIDFYFRRLHKGKALLSGIVKGGLRTFEPAAQ